MGGKSLTATGTDTRTYSSFRYPGTVPRDPQLPAPGRKGGRTAGAEVCDL